MNKQDIGIVVLLVLLLFGWTYTQNKTTKERRAAWEAQQAAIAATNTISSTSLSLDAQNTATLSAPANPTNTLLPRLNETTAAGVAAAEEAVEDTGVEEKLIKLSDGEVEVSVSSKGATIKNVSLNEYRSAVEKDSAPVCFDYYDSPALAIHGIRGLEAFNDFTASETTSTSVLFSATAKSGLKLDRRITLLPDYKISVRDSFTKASDAAVEIPAYDLSIGSISDIDKGMQALSVDTLSATRTRRGNLGKVLHWEKEKKLVNLFTGGRGGGCFSSAPDTTGMPFSVKERNDNDAQEWVALKSRFFALAFTTESAAAPVGYEIAAARSAAKGPFRISEVSGKYIYPKTVLDNATQSIVNDHTLYVGPKKYSIIKKFAEKSGEIMEFGYSKWLCVILLPILNGLFFIFRNYGVAIIILTILVRLIFWPLTRKSNESMKKMGAIQPKIKELQEKFKDDPQKLQQETMKFYRENNINPMASCLPMLIQIPVFIALFVVLRSATELRFAPFLWIADLSEPENILKGVIPGVPAINLLPFVMAGTMFLQSKLTPSMGDPKQQKMMMWMMPLMMFFMFYSMPSALLLYWSVSQILAIVQLIMQRRKNSKATAVVGADGVIEGETMTRQERRRISRQ